MLVAVVAFSKGTISVFVVALGVVVAAAGVVVAGCGVGGAVMVGC